MNDRRRGAGKRTEKFGKEIWRSSGLPGLLEVLSMGRSEKDYRRRADLLFSFCSRMRFHLRPSQSLDNSLCDYADFQNVDGEGVEHGEQLKASLYFRY